MSPGGASAALVPLLSLCLALQHWPHSVARYHEFIDRYPVERFDFQPWPHKRGRLLARRNPRLLELSDWYFGVDWGPHPHFQFRRSDPNTVYAYPERVLELLRALARCCKDSPRDRVLVLGSSDSYLSEAFGNATHRAAVVAGLSRYFRAIFFEAKDIEFDGIYTKPAGLSESYLGASTAAAAERAIAGARLAAKPRQALAASAGHFDISVYGPTPRESREGLGAWAASAAARAAGVEVRRVEPSAWWEELASYRFLLSPLGRGIQSAKTVEALLLLTVPIVQRGPHPAHDDLVRMGFPLVVIDDWANVTAARLEAWWTALSPRLEAFRQRCLSPEAWWRIFTSTDHRCE